MKTTASIYFRDRPSAKGLCPIYLRLTKNRKNYTKRIAEVESSGWDKGKNKVKSSVPNYRAINTKLKKALNDAEAYILDCEIKNLPADPARYLKTGRSSTIYDLCVVERDKAEEEGRIRTAQRWKTNANKVKDFGDVSPDNMTLDWLEKFDRWMKTELKNNPNTRAKTLSEIARFNRSAFENFKMPSNVSIKDKLEMHEVEKLEKTDFGNGRLQQAVHMWLFSMYNRGIRVHNLFTMQWANIVDGRLEYWTQKGESNEKSKFHSIKLIDKALAILEIYKGQDDKYIFPFMRVEHESLSQKEFLRKISSWTSILNNNYKKAEKRAGIKKKIRNHSARHTFAYLVDKSGRDLRIIQHLLGHGDRKTTEAYIRALRNDDEMDEAVEGLF